MSTDLLSYITVEYTGFWKKENVRHPKFFYVQPHKQEDIERQVKQPLSVSGKKKSDDKEWY